MPIKHFQTASILAVLLLLIGCGRNGSDKRLVETAVKVETQQASIERIVRQLDELGARLDGIEASLREIRSASDHDVPAKGRETQGLDFKDTPEYKQMAAALSTLQQGWDLMQNKVKQLEREQKRHFDDRSKALGDPQELTKRLDALVEVFGPKIQEPLQKHAFEADVEQLKWINLENPSPEEFHSWAVSDLTQRLGSSPDEPTRKWIEQQLKDLESASVDELDGVLQRIRDFENRARLGELARAYGIPEDDLLDAGVPHMDPPYVPALLADVLYINTGEFITNGAVRNIEISPYIGSTAYPFEKIQTVGGKGRK